MGGVGGWVCVYVCVVGVYGFFVIEVCPSFFLLSITSSKNPYRRPFSEFQSHFVYGGLDGGLDDGVGGGEQEVAGGGGSRRREGGDSRRSSSENPHRVADQSGRKTTREQKNASEPQQLELQTCPTVISRVST